MSGSQDNVPSQTETLEEKLVRIRREQEQGKRPDPNPGYDGPVPFKKSEWEFPSHIYP